MDTDVRAVYPWIDSVMAEDDANDPLLELYQDIEDANKFDVGERE